MGVAAGLGAPAALLSVSTRLETDCALGVVSGFSCLRLVWVSRLVAAHCCSDGPAEPHAAFSAETLTTGRCFGGTAAGAAVWRGEEKEGEGGEDAE